jgi:hypothetical protein
MTDSPLKAAPLARPPASPGANRPRSRHRRRTAIGTSFKGSLTETPAIELAEAVIAGAVQRSGLDPAEIDDVIFG